MTSRDHLEIERKFLVIRDDWRNGPPGVRYRQGYLARSDSCVVRSRVGGGEGFLTVKQRRPHRARLEYEYRIPAQDAANMIDTLCAKRVVEKTRYLRPFKGMTWEVDEFHGDNGGLVIAEVELEHEHQSVDIPPWVGEDVTDDGRYANAWLSEHPFSTWTHEA